MADEDLSAEIREAATGVARMTVDGQSAEAVPVKDVIEADRYLAARNAAKKRRCGLRFMKLVPPGSV